MKRRTFMGDENETAVMELCEAVAAIGDETEAYLFLKDLCTPAELQAMADRWKVVGPLIVGKPYRKIYEETGVSATTVGRVARYIAQGNGGYQIIYKRIQKNNYGKHRKTTKDRNPKKRPSL